MQDHFLNQARRGRIPLAFEFLSGTRMEGVVQSFDNFSVLVENPSGTHLIYKHGITSLSTAPGAPRIRWNEGGRPEGAPEPSAAEAPPPKPPTATGEGGAGGAPPAS